MSTKVIIQNNPYMQRVRILINGKPASMYGALEQYQDEPFWNWCDHIIEEVYHECNESNIDLVYIGREEENTIFKRIAEEYPYCSYQFRPFSVQQNFQQKLKALSVFISAHHFNVGQKHFKVAFYLSKKYLPLKNDFLNLEVSNVYCEIKPLIYELSYFETTCMSNDFNFIIDEKIEAKKIANLCSNLFCFLLHIGSENIFEKKLKRIFVYQCSIEQIFSTVFDCLKLVPLLMAFRECVQTIFNSDLLSVYENSNEFLQILSIEKPFYVDCENNIIEVGKSVSIHINQGEKQFAVEQIHFEYEKQGILSCNGLRVTEHAPGNCKMYMFRKGENTPFYTMEFKVIQRNRISEIVLEDGTFFIGEGDKYKLTYHYYPLDADNTDQIKWTTDNKNGLQISDAGVVSALKTGQYRIYCSAEQVSSSVVCVVKPYMREIQMDESDIKLLLGETYSLQYTFSPINCIDDEVCVNSENLQIINSVGSILKAVGCGETDVTVSNKRGTVKRQVHVIVETEEKIEKKKGVFARLFGRL